MADDERLLHRQVHPSWSQDGRITSQAFTPTPKDEGLLSVYDGEQVTPEASFIHFTTVKKLSAIGTASVTAAEVRSLELPWRLDPETFAEHAVIDFTALLSSGRVKAKAQALAEKARIRGWTYKV
jgi:hypothetical protein